MNKLRVLFIWPRNEDTMLGVPLGYAYLLSNCRGEAFEFELLDCILDNLESGNPRLLERVRAFAPQMVAISAASSNFPEATAILRSIKAWNPQVVTLLGGPHATVYGPHAFACPDLDFLFRGEGEVGLKAFFEAVRAAAPERYPQIPGLAYRDGEGQPFFNAPAKIDDLDALSYPDYEAIALDRYIEQGYNYMAGKARCAPIYCTRGCPYICKFCSVPSVSGKRVRKHSVPYLIGLVHYLYEEKGIRGFNVVDDNFTFDVDFAKEFCREIIRLGLEDLEFNSPNGIRMQRGDAELWSLMRQAGWKSVTVAPESGSKRVLQLMKKDLDPGLVPGIVVDMKQAGLRVKGFFIIGYPGETPEDLRQTARLIEGCRFDEISVTYFQPMPGTPVCDELIAQGELSPNQLPGYFGNGDNPVYVTRSLAGFDLPLYRSYLVSLVENRDNFVQLLTTDRLQSLTDIYVVGSGSFAAKLIDKLNEFDLPVTGVIDEIHEGPTFHGVRVYSVLRGDLDRSRSANAIFLMAISIDQYRRNAVERLGSRGVPKRRILYFDPVIFEKIFSSKTKTVELGKLVLAGLQPSDDNYVQANGDLMERYVLKNEVRSRQVAGWG